MDEAAADNPLRLDARQLVPARHPRFVSGRDEPLAFYMVVYPDPARPEPPEASLELYRAGALVARGAIALPARAGTMPYVGSFPVGKLPPADYEMKVVVRQGSAIAMESATFEMCCRDAGARYPSASGSRKYARKATHTTHNSGGTRRARPPSSLIAP
jgi:hypothetical protein